MTLNKCKHGYLICIHGKIGSCYACDTLRIIKAMKKRKVLG